MPTLSTRRSAWVRRRVNVCLDRAAKLVGPYLDRGPDRLIGLGKVRRVVARRRRMADAASRLMDYGPDWPPAPEPPPYPHLLLRRCVAAVVLYALIWALGSALLQLRLFELHNLGNGAPVTTYTTVTTPHHH
jgi:hypothetical protein